MKDALFLGCLRLGILINSEVSRLFVNRLRIQGLVIEDSSRSIIAAFILLVISLLIYCLVLFHFVRMGGSLDGLSSASETHS